MTYHMASIIKKMVHGRAYYYARECRRVDGKPKIVWQKYLGRADDLIAAATRPQTAAPAQPQEGEGEGTTGRVERIRNAGRAQGAQRCKRQPRRPERRP